VRENTPLPDAILNAPELMNGLAFYLSAWQELGYDRPVGFGAGPIPSRSIREYAKDMEMDCDDLFMFEHIIRAIDRFFLERSNKEKK
jgi:hypothetical protein